MNMVDCGVNHISAVYVPYYAVKLSLVSALISQNAVPNLALVQK